MPLRPFWFHRPIVLFVCISLLNMNLAPLVTMAGASTDNLLDTPQSAQPSQNTLASLSTAQPIRNAIRASTGTEHMATLAPAPTPADSAKLALATFAPFPAGAQNTPFQPLAEAAANLIQITETGFSPNTLNVFGPTDVTWVNNTNSPQTLHSGAPGQNPSGANKIFMPLVKRGSANAIQAAAEYLQYLRRDAAASPDFSATLGPGQTFSYRFITPGQYQFYLVNAPQFTGQLALAGTALLHTSPTNGEDGVSATRETILEFSGPLDPATVTTAAFVARFGNEDLAYRLNLSPDKTRVTLFYTKPLPGSARIRVTVDGNQLKDTQGGGVDVDGDGAAGGNALLEFDTLSLTVVPGTSVCGRVFASELAVTASNVSVNTPLAGVTISVAGMEDALNAKTDANGNFCLNPAPSGRFFVHIDGHTATNNVPAGAYYPFVGKLWESIPGQQTSIGDAFLPLVVAGTLHDVNKTEQTLIVFPDSVLKGHPEFAGVSIMVPPDSLFNDDGSRGGKVGIAPVPPDRLPGKLPPGLNFPVVLTVQTDGASNFDTPAPVCFPNLPDAKTGKALAAGEKSALWSYDHDAGHWGVVGPMTVTSDGRLVCTDAGVGIRAPGWHGSQPGSEVESPNETAEDCSGIGWDDAWSVAKTIGGCFKKMAATLQGFGGGIDAIRSAYELGAQLRTLHDQYAAGKITIEDVKKTVESMKGVKDGLKDVWEAFSQQNPVSKLKQATECGLNLATTVKDVICNHQECLGSTTQLICEKVVPLLDLAQSLIEKADELDKSIREAPLEALCLAFDSLLAGLAIPGQQALASNTPDANIIDLLNSTIIQAELFTTSTRPIENAYTRIKELNDTMADMQQSSNTIVASKGGISNAYYRMTVNGAELRGKTSQSGLIQLRVAPNANYRLEILVLQSNTTLVSEGVTPSNGQRAQLALYVPVDLSSEVDTDVDGIPDIAEPIVGTDPNNPDTDGDSIKDGAEVQNGTNPLDGLAAQTGIIGSASTPGAAVDICVHNALAVLAEGDKGISIFNIFDNRNPTIVAQVDTPGNVQRVACADKRVAVADGDNGLALVDLSNLANPRLANQLNLNGKVTAVAMAGDTIYAGMATGRLVAVDLATSAIKEEITLPAAVNDLSISGDFLYVLTDNNNLQVIKPREGLRVINTKTTQATQGTNQRLFAGTDILYTTHIRGYNTFSLVTPDNPTLLAAGSTAQFGWRQFVTNGARMGVAVSGVNSNTPRDIWLYDVSDPTKTDAFQTQFNTPGDAGAVALYRGLAYVADGLAGLQVINYLAYDNLKVAPTLSLLTSFNASKAEENALTRITAVAKDDVQVRNVEFYIDGNLAAADNSYPFEYRFTTPRLANQPAFRLRTRAIDTGGNSTWSDEATITLVPDATPPRIISFTPAEATNPAGLVKDVSATFSEAIQQTTLAAENFKVVTAGADNRLGTADDPPLTGGAITYDDTNKKVTLTFSAPLPVGLYRVTVTAAVSDLAGNPLTVEFAWDFGVGQQIPIGRVIGSELSTAGEQDVYKFVAAAKQSIYFDDQNASRPGQFYWRLQDSSGATIFQDNIDKHDPGSFTLDLGGEYTLSVGGYNNATGSYQFQLRSNPPDAFTINMGDTIKDGQPGRGAGNIELPGNVDRYTFTATANQQVYFDDQNSSTPSYFVWDVYDPNGNRIIRDGLDGNDPGSYQLTLAGQYTIYVWAYANIAGTYQFQLRSNPPDAFTINMGDTIKDGQPGAGAGNIEIPGNVDRYTFTATANQQVYFDDQNSSTPSYFVWDVYDPNGNRIIRDGLDGNDPGSYQLTLAGQYTIYVWAYANIAGTYQFQLRSNPPDAFTINMGDTIRDGQPGAGAGNIEIPGNVDKYTFTATANQQVYFDDQNSSTPSYFVWDVYDPTGNRIIRDGLDGNDPGSYQLTLAGEYTIYVWAYANIAGNYQFQLRSNPPDAFAINIGDVIQDGKPGVGAGNIEIPGNVDKYTFTATANQQVYFDDQNSSRPGYFVWDVYDPNGNRIIRDGLDGNDPGIRQLTLAGQYTIYVWAYANIAGNYQFQIRPPVTDKSAPDGLQNTANTLNVTSPD